MGCCQFAGIYGHDYKNGVVEMLVCTKRHLMMSHPFSKWGKVLYLLEIAANLNKHKEELKGFFNRSKGKLVKRGEGHTVSCYRLRPHSPWMSL